MTDTAQIETRLLAALADIRTHWGALIAPSSGRSGGAPTNDDVTALDRRVSLRHEVTLCLNGWARVIVEDFHVSHRLPLGTDTLGLVELIERWARLFSGHEGARAAADEIETKAAEVVKAAAPEGRAWLLLGACPLEVEILAVLQVCGGSVRKYPERLPACERCGTEGPRGWWEAAMFPEADGGDLVTADQLAGLVQRAFGGKRAKPESVRQWARRYGLATTPGPDGRLLYDRAEVVRKLSERMEGSA